MNQERDVFKFSCSIAPDKFTKEELVEGIDTLRNFLLEKKELGLGVLLVSMGTLSASLAAKVSYDPETDFARLIEIMTKQFHETLDERKKQG